MIPVLYQENETSFVNNGLGRLADAISCKVTEERNGVFELVMTYPVSGIHFSDIKENRIVYATTEDGERPQPFIIYKITKPINGIVTINAEHVSYLLNGYIVLPFSAVSPSDAMSKINDNAYPSPTGFTFTTDVTSATSYKNNEPRSIRSLLGGSEGSLLDTYGGYDYRFDHFDVKLLQDRGADRGVTIRYGKNLTDLKAVNDATNIFTGIIPIWTDNEGTYVYATDVVIYSSHASDYAHRFIRVVDFSNRFEQAPTRAQLQAAGESYLSGNDGWKIKNNINVSFVALAETEEYKDIAPLERVKLCDTVTVNYLKMGVTVKTKVIKTVYDTLLDRYESITLGDTTYSLAQAIQEANQTPTKEQTTSIVQNAVSKATELIRGGLGGHVVMVADGNGKPQEILIMDTEDINTAEHVWRWNMNGLGYSSNGYEGPYGLAITMNGEIVADYITAGTFDGGLVRAGSISTNALSVDAREEFNAIHSYLPYDLFDNTGRFSVEWGSGQFTYYYENITHEGQTKKALVIDGTAATEPYTAVGAIRFKTDLVGDNMLDLKFKIKSTSTIVASEQQMYCGYYVGNSQLYTELYKFPGTVVADTVYEVDKQITLAGGAANPAYDSFVYMYAFRGTKVYLFDFELTAGGMEYTKSQLAFTADGLNTLVQQGSIISQINQSAEAVTIQASKIDLTGNVSLKGEFKAINPNDPGDYVDMNTGAIAVYNDNSLIFTVSSTPLTGANAGIFFGDPDDGVTITRYTHITQDIVATPAVKIIKDSTTPTPTSPGDLLVGGDSSFYGSSVFYGNVYNNSGTVVFVSDRRKKKNIKSLIVEKAKAFIMGLKPREFEFKKEIASSGRKHHGFIAQEVKETMGSDDWGVYVEDKDTDFIGLRYDELLADMVTVIQDQQKRIDALERMVYDNAKN